MDLLRKNFGLKLLAVALAIVGWAYFRFATNPLLASGQVDQQLSVPIVSVNLPSGYVAHYTDREALVSVATKRGEPGIKPEEIKAVLDLSNKGEGIYNVPVQLVAPEVAVQSLSPASVTLTIERLEDRAFPIVVHFMGSLSHGIVVNAVRVRPSVATVRAATSAQISGVHVDVELPSEPKAIDEMVRPIAVDASGGEITSASVSPDLVRVQMRFVPAVSK